MAKSNLQAESGLAYSHRGQACDGGEVWQQTAGTGNWLITCLSTCGNQREWMASEVKLQNLKAYFLGCTSSSKAPTLKSPITSWNSATNQGQVLRYMSITFKPPEPCTMQCNIAKVLTWLAYLQREQRQIMPRWGVCPRGDDWVHTDPERRSSRKLLTLCLTGIWNQSKNIKLGDSGLARIFKHDMSFEHLLACHIICLLNKWALWYYYEKSNIWSLGCLMYPLCALMPQINSS